MVVAKHRRRSSLKKDTKNFVQRGFYGFSKKGDILKLEAKWDKEKVPLMWFDVKVRDLL